MSGLGLDQRDVYRAVLDRIRSGAYAAGSRLPSCRALADEIGSNPNTVHRALQVLQDEGIVRTVPRKGTYVTDLASVPETAGWLADEVAKLVARATAAGIDPATLREIVDETLLGVSAPTPVLFVECNDTDLEEMAASVEGATGLELDRVRLDELQDRLATTGDAVVAVPLFHLGEVRPLVPDGTPLVELSFVNEASGLVSLATLDPTVRVTVASRRARGVDRLASIVRQYFVGEVEERLLGDDDVDLSDAELVVFNNGSELRPSELATPRRTLRVSVVLDGTSASTLRQRIELALNADAALAG